VAQRTEVVEIDGKRFEITQWGAEDQILVFPVVGRAFSGPAGLALKFAGDGMKEIDSRELAQAFECLKGEDLLFICNKLAKATRYESGRDGKGDPVMITLGDRWQTQFGGDALEFLPIWLWEGLKLNYARFLGGKGIASIANIVAENTPAPSKSPTESNG
jgi:hypothetical protein